MSLEKVFSFYDKITEAPETASHLRSFILNCAMRGKLVQQDPNDESAFDLFQKIMAKKTQLLENGALPKVKREPNISGTAPFELPNGWTWVAFGDLHNLVRGVTYSKSDISEKPSKGFIPVLRANNIGVTLTRDKPVFVNCECVRQEQILRKGDFFIALSSGSKKLVGKAVYVSEDSDEAFGGFCGVIRVYYSELIKFVDIYLQSSLYRESVSAGSRGIGINNLQKEILANLYFPLPPLAEQKRIVARVDELMALCDQLESAKAEGEDIRKNLTTASFTRLGAPRSDSKEFNTDAVFALSNLNNLTAHSAQIAVVRQTIFNLAVRGRLTEQNATDESASKLLKRITADKKQRIESIRNKRIDISAPAVVSTPPYQAPEGWLWVQFGDITISRDGERVPVSKEERKKRTKTYDYYGASGVIDKIDGYLFDKPLLLIGEDGANLINRSTPIAFIARGKYWVNNHAHVLDGLSEEYLRYIEIFINAIELKPYVTGSAQPKMNQKKMNSIPVALPPLAEQKRIVAKVDELMALCDELEANLAAGDAARKDLMAAVLREAFEAPA